MATSGGGSGDTGTTVNQVDLSFDGSATEDDKGDLHDLINKDDGETQNYNGPVTNGYLERSEKVEKLGKEIYAETIDDAAAVIVDHALSSAVDFVRDGVEDRVAAVTFISPSTSDSGITMMTNGTGGREIMMDPVEPNGSTTTETSALSEVTDSINLESHSAPLDLADIGIGCTATRSAPVIDLDCSAAGAVTATAQIVDINVGMGDAQEPVRRNDIQKEQEKPEEFEIDIPIPSIKTHAIDDDDEFSMESPTKRKDTDVIPSIRMSESNDDDEFSIETSPKATPQAIPNISIHNVDKVETSSSPGDTGLGLPSIHVIAASPCVEEKNFPASDEAGSQQQPVYSSAQSEAQEEWDAVKEITPVFNKDGASGASTAVEHVEEAPPLLPYHDAFLHIQKSDLQQYESQIQTCIQRRGFSKIKHVLFGPPKLHRDLHNERDMIFCMAASQLNQDDPVHTQILQTLFRRLTGSKFLCSRFGSHWEQIGFQETFGNDPATDLRGSGMLGLLHLLHFVTEPRLHGLVRDVYRLSQHEEQNFPFCLMGINMSRLCIQILREDYLNKECNKRKAVMDILNDFYVAAYYHLYSIWKSQGKTIKDSGFVIRDVETYARKNPLSLLRNLETYLDKNKESKTSNLTPVNFKGVGEVESDEEN